MSETKLLLDIGNTRLKWAYAEGAELKKDRVNAGTLGEFKAHCERNKENPPGRILLSSVAGLPAIQGIANVCSNTWSTKIEVLQSKKEQGGVRNAYDEPQRLGVDRWLALVGAVARYGKPVVVWDLGTATTLDAVDEYGEHIGGWILPGPQSMFHALKVETQLSVPERMDAEEDSGVVPPGRSTREAIDRGVYAAQKGALNQFMKNFGASATQPKIIITGGADRPMQEYMGHICIRDPFLVFRGMLVDE